MSTYLHFALARYRAAFALLSLLSLLSVPPCVAQVNVLTYHNNIARTGQNMNETLLTPANVNAAQFGKLMTRSLDAGVCAQPLYMSGLTVNGGVHNVVFVATQNCSVYAFDADNNQGNNGSPLWKVSLVPGVGASPSGYGICGTPVIDPATNTIYMVATTSEGGTVIHRLHALNVTTGAEKFNGPVIIQATVAGTGDASDGNGHLPFYGAAQRQRAGLLLVGGVVYVAFGASAEIVGIGGTGLPYHGWLFGYNAATLQQKYVFCTTPNGKTDPSGYPIGGGGVWQGGGAPCSDGSNIYIETGNGAFTLRQTAGSYDSTISDFADAFLKLGIVNNNLQVLDYFAPYNQYTLDVDDDDLGATGVMALPDAAGSAAHPHLLVGSNKDGRIFLLDRSNLGKYTVGSDPSVDNVLQWLPAGTIGGVWGMPAYYNGAVYYGGQGDAIKAFPVANGVLAATPMSQTSNGFGYPGAEMNVSGNSANPATTGIVWAVEHRNGINILHAYDAANLSNELYNTTQAPGRDDVGVGVAQNYTGFTPPIVANGKVYVVAPNALSVYGAASFAASPVITPGGGNYYPSVQVTITESTPNAFVHYTLDGSTPTTASPLYTGPFTVSRSLTVNARAFATGVTPSGTASAAFQIFPNASNGTGLTGYYYNDPGNTFPNFFTTFVLSEVDPNVNFTLNTTPNWPPAGVGSGGANFSARWVGQIQAPASELYTFYATSDDGIRVFVNGQNIIDGWVFQGPTTYTGVVALTAGQKADIEVNWFQGGGGANAILEWSNPSLPRQVVPQFNLFPLGAITAAPVLTAQSSDGEVDLSWTAPDNATDYVIQRSVMGGPFTTVGTSKASYYADTSVTNGVMYCYQVSASNPLPSTSSLSNVACATPAASPVGTGLTGYYYNDPGNTFPNFFTTFVRSKVDPTINFTLGSTTNWPPAGMGSSGSNFSARWAGQLRPKYTGAYTFYATSDDGIRVFINGQKIIDGWVFQGPTTYTATVNLTGMTKVNIEVDWFQGGGGATAVLEWSGPNTLRHVVPSAALFPFGPVTASPVLSVLPGDSEAVLSWTTADNATGYQLKRSATHGGPYTTIATTDGTTFEDTGLTNGVTYYYVVVASNFLPSTSGLSNEVAAAPAPGLSGKGLTGYYYNDPGNTYPNFFTTFVLSEVDATINFNQGSTPNWPPVGVGSGGANFSVRWIGQVLPQYSENYTFYATGDDGIRVFVNGQNIIDGWVDQGPTTYTSVVALTAGQKADIEVDWYQNQGGATAILEWSSPSTPRQVIPRFNLFVTPNLSGTLALEGISPVAPTQTIHFTFRPNDMSSAVNWDVPVGPDGNYTLTDIPKKAGALHIKGDKYLAANLAVDASSGSVANANAMLLTGDANNDNQVDILDFSALVNAFGASISDPNYNAATDFNGDGVVDIGDFGLLVNNYLSTGAP